MKFEIGFNKIGEQNDKLLEEIGAKLVELNARKYPPFEYYQIELNSLEEMEALHKLVHEKTKLYYSFVVNFDRPTIYLDKDV